MSECMCQFCGCSTQREAESALQARLAECERERDSIFALMLKMEQERDRFEKEAWEYHAGLVATEQENYRLKHDLERHIAIAAEHVTRVAELEQVIRDAPHTVNCACVSWGPAWLPRFLQSVDSVNPFNCNCWKRDALTKP